MPRYICQINNKFFEWSTIVDAPVTFGMTRSEFEEYYQHEYGRSAIDELPKRLDRAIKNGTSGHGYDSIHDLVTYNRAGHDETCLTIDELERIYLIEKRDPVEGEGKPIVYDD